MFKSLLRVTLGAGGRNYRQCPEHIYGDIHATCYPWLRMSTESGGGGRDLWRLPLPWDLVTCAAGLVQNQVKSLSSSFCLNACLSTNVPGPLSNTRAMQKLQPTAGKREFFFSGQDTETFVCVCVPGHWILHEKHNHQKSKFWTAPGFPPKNFFKAHATSELTRPSEIYILSSKFLMRTAILLFIRKSMN